MALFFRLCFGHDKLFERKVNDLPGEIVQEEEHRHRKADEVTEQHIVLAILVGVDEEDYEGDQVDIEVEFLQQRGPLQLQVLGFGDAQPDRQS